MSVLRKSFWRMVSQSVVCQIRLCQPDVIIHDGLVSFEQKNQGADQETPKRYFFMTIRSCSQCGRQVNTFWTKQRVREWKKKKK